MKTAASQESEDRLLCALALSTPIIEQFSLELAAFAREVRASPTKQIVLVLDGAGWHDSPKVRVSEHVHLLFLPAHSPELQPAEYLWPLTDTALVNRHFATIDDLEDAQAERCVALLRRPDLIRATPRFRWWPRRIAKRRGPRPGLIAHETTPRYAASRPQSHRQTSHSQNPPPSPARSCSDASR
jgi:transposase